MVQAAQSVRRFDNSDGANYQFFLQFNSVPLSASSSEENGSKSLFVVQSNLEAMKRQSLESCARDFVNNLKKSAMARSSREVESEQPVEQAAPASKWDAFVGNAATEGWDLCL